MKACKTGQIGKIQQKMEKGEKIKQKTQKQRKYRRTLKKEESKKSFSKRILRKMSLTWTKIKIPSAKPIRRDTDSLVRARIPFDSHVYNNINELSHSNSSLHFVYISSILLENSQSLLANKKQLNSTIGREYSCCCVI